jgi:hypothetical protein
MDLLIDFANVGKWDRKAFFAIGEKFGWKVILSKPMLFDMLKRYLFDRGKITHEHYMAFLDEKNRPQELSSCAVCALENPTLENLKFYNDPVMPGDELFEKFLGYMNGLSLFWRWIVKDTAKNGPANLVLNYIMRIESIEVSFQEGENPWKPKLSALTGLGYLEVKLAADYLEPFTHGNGEIYKRIRICNDPDCGKLFVFNRPKQNFCNDECRYHFHNVVKIRNGYLAEHQRRGRQDNPATYVRK